MDPFAWPRHYPLPALLILLQSIDVLFAGFYRCLTGEISSEISGRGMIRKVVMLTFVAVGAVVDQYLGGGPWCAVIAAFFCYHELISVIENAALLGVPIPPAVLRMLAMFQDMASMSGKLAGGSRHVDMVDDAVAAVERSTPKRRAPDGYEYVGMDHARIYIDPATGQETRIPPSAGQGYVNPYLPPDYAKTLMDRFPPVGGGVQAGEETGDG